MRRQIGALSLAVVLAATTKHLPPTSAQASHKDPPPYNIMLVTPDQLRADFMHTYGYPLADTPNIDQLATEGTSFFRAYSAGPWTTPSFGSILTGLFPTVHGMTLPPPQSCGPDITRPMISGGMPPVPPFLTLSPHKPILPEMLKSHGMTTAVDIANCWAIWDVAQRGWDDFQFFVGYQQAVAGHPDAHDPFYLTAPKTLAWAEQWLEAHRARRFFLWVHLMEPHSPYNAPREYDRFKTADDYPDVYEDNNRDAVRLQSRAKIGDTHAIRRLEQLYCSKILYVDHYVGELMRTAKALGLDENTVVILVSDHGQLLYSHPEDFNTDDHRSVYDADLHIPLIFRGPGIPAGKRVSALVSQVDLVPTLLDLEGLSPGSPMDGSSLKPLFTEPFSEVHPYLFGEESVLEPQYSARDSRYKLIESLRSGAIQCFDTERDPGEKRDICFGIPQKAAELKRALDEHIRAVMDRAKTYSDWENNLALAVLEQRDSQGLRALAPRDLTVRPGSGAGFQLTGKRWRLSSDQPECMGPCYWAPGVSGEDFVVWRFDTPMVGEYEISIWYRGALPGGQALATDSSFTVRFKGGSLSFPVDLNRNQERWNLLGRFHDPVSVEMTNRSDGPVVAGAVRFHRVG